jgi:hypothetical protein
MEETKNVYKILVEKPEEKTPLRRPRCRWENNIRMYLEEKGWEGMDPERDQWQALVNTVMNFWVPY